VPLEVRIERLAISDGTELPVPPTGVVAIVGPNNTGKSAALRETFAHLSAQPDNPERPRRVVRRVDIHKQATEDELREWLEAQCFAMTQRSTGERIYRRPQVGPVGWPQLLAEWNGYPTAFGPNLAQFFVSSGSAETRLTLVAGTAQWDPMNDSPSNPMQVLFASRDLEQRLSDVSVEAFGVPLTLARLAGSQINLHVGTAQHEPDIVPNEDYMHDLRNLPLVQEQGDGIRSFLGIMLTLVAASYPVVLVDEPEAFLHPPQARLLGRKLAAEATDRAQVIVATHSIDVLLGLLDAQGANVTIARMTRAGDINPVSVLRPDELRELWRDPLLRYSNVLDALFHRGVILCEGDTDARYYGAVLEASLAARGDPPHDLLITHVGGKARLASVVVALSAVSVPAAVIADLDLLREEERLRALVEALGGDWGDLRPDWQVVDAAVQGLARNPQIAYVREQVVAVLDNAARGSLAPNEADRIREAIRVEDGWTQAKRAGTQLIPQGNASDSCARLIERLRGLGLFIADVGEVERWEPGVPGRSSAWVKGVLEQELHASDATRARPFVLAVADFFE